MSELPPPSFNRNPPPLEPREAGQKSFAVASRWKRLFWNKGVSNSLERNNEEFHRPRSKVEGGRLFVQWLRGATTRQAQRLRALRRQAETDKTKANYDRYASALSMAQYAINLSVRYETEHERHVGRKGQA